MYFYKIKVSVSKAFSIIPDLNNRQSLTWQTQMILILIFRFKSPINNGSNLVSPWSASGHSLPRSIPATRHRSYPTPENSDSSVDVTTSRPRPWSPSAADDAAYKGVRRRLQLFSIARKISSVYCTLRVLYPAEIRSALQSGASVFLRGRLLLFF